MTVYAYGVRSTVGTEEHLDLRLGVKCVERQAGLGIGDDVEHVGVISSLLVESVGAGLVLIDAGILDLDGLHEFAIGRSGLTTPYVSVSAVLGAAVGLRKGRHLGVRLFVEKLPEGVYNKFFVPVIQAVMFGFFLVVVDQGIGFCQRGAFQVSPAMDLPMFWVYLSIPVGGSLMALNVASDFLQDRFPTFEGSNANIASAVMENIGDIQKKTDAPVEIFDPIHNPEPEDKEREP